MPENGFIKAWIAQSYLNSGDNGKAVTYYKEALRCKPDYAMVHYNLAVILMAMNNTKEAILQFLETARYKPDMAEPFLNIGVILYNSGRSDEAANFFRKALLIEPNLPSARFNLAQYYACKHEWPEAIAEYQKTIALWPENTYAVSGLAACLQKNGAEGGTP